jgi:hypothetical protein
MADFKKSSTAPEARMSEARPPHDQGSFPDSCAVCEAPKLGSESVANFSQGPGVAPSRNKIH